jgi:hypothetical protein
MSDVTPQLDFDVGLVQVTFQHEPDAAPSLLSLECVAPPNPYFELQLEEVLYVPASLEERLMKALQPNITHRDVVQPWNFSALISQVQEWLRTRSRDGEPLKARQKFLQAARTLEEFGALAGVLRRFQHALHRG